MSPHCKAGLNGGGTSDEVAPAPRHAPPPERPAVRTQHGDDLGLDREAVREPSDGNAGDDRTRGAKEGAGCVDAPAPGIVRAVGDIVAVDLHDVVEGGAVLREDPSDLLQDVGRLAREVVGVADLPGRIPRHLAAHENHVAAAHTLRERAGQSPVPRRRAHRARQPASDPRPAWRWSRSRPACPDTRGRGPARS